MKKILPIIKEKKIKVITNGGGVNPVACADAILEYAVELGIEKIKIAVVLGDDIKGCLDVIIGSGNELNNMETGESITKIQDKIYLLLKL